MKYVVRRRDGRGTFYMVAERNRYGLTRRPEEATSFDSEGVASNLASKVSDALRIPPFSVVARVPAPTRSTLNDVDLQSRMLKHMRGGKSEITRRVAWATHAVGKKVVARRPTDDRPAVACNLLVITNDRELLEEFGDE